MSRDCIFCKIVRGEIPSHKIYDNEHAFAFLDIHPLVEGHVMVIPKSHYERLEDVPVSQLEKLFEAVQKISTAAKDSFAATATTIGINNGSAAGQVVPHLHIHVLPRFENDGGGSIHSIIRKAPKHTLDEVGQILRSVIS